MKYQVTIGNRTLAVTVEGDRISVDGTTCHAELRAMTGTPLRLLLVDQATWVMALESTGPHTWQIQETGERSEVQVLDERTAHIRSLVGAGAAAAGPRELKAPMPGLVARILVEPGQSVASGQSLVVLEAMKMENELKSAGAAVVDRVEVTPGSTVEKGALLVTFRATPAPLL